MDDLQERRLSPSFKNLYEELCKVALAAWPQRALSDA
jgi:hypothetical protein